MKKRWAGIGALLFAIVGVVGVSAGVAQAHTPSVTADCSGISYNLTKYEGPNQGDSINNYLSIYVDGQKMTEIPFATALSGKYDFDGVTNHTWKVVIDANVVTGNPTQYDSEFSGEVTGCVPARVEICHRDQGKPEWKLITISSNALPAHLSHQWGEDIYPVPADGCPVPPPTTTEPPPPTAIPVDPTVTDPTCDAPGVVVLPQDPVGYSWVEQEDGTYLAVADEGFVFEEDAVLVFDPGDLSQLTEEECETTTTTEPECEGICGPATTTTPPPVVTTDCIQYRTGGPNLPDGQYVIISNSYDVGVTGSVDVSGQPCGPIPTTTTTVHTPQLATTGSNGVGIFAGLGALLIAAGGSLVLARRF